MTWKHGFALRPKEEKHFENTGMDDRHRSRRLLKISPRTLKDRAKRGLLLNHPSRLAGGSPCGSSCATSWMKPSWAAMPTSNALRPSGVRS